MKLARISKHPSLDIVSSDGAELNGKKIVLCVAGSVAAYKSIELARLLMRHGASVTCVASDAATKLIQPAYFKWATGNPVITKLTGDLEHIAIADYKKSDLIIVYPSTANTLGKLANGIDDTPIATVLTVGFGSKIPIVMCLAMHASMYENAAVKKNIAFLEKKIDFVSPNMIEGKAKAAEPEDVLEFVLRKFGFSSVLKGKRVLITAGPTIEFLDPIRVITNQSTGRTGVLLADELVSAGAKVTMVYGPGREKPPKGVRLVSVKTAKEMLLAVKNEMKKKFDIVIMAAAPSDYTPEKPSGVKIKSTSKKMTLTLNRVPKIIDQVKKMQKDVFLVGFKALARVTKKELEKEARRKIRECGADLMIANDVGSQRYRKNPENNEVLIVGSNRTLASGWKKKEKIVKLIRKEIEKRIEKT
jgi:phosphopantothenoylcysteine decarboxylase/phosphopantothenate--cysteine ligase